MFKKSTLEDSNGIKKFQTNVKVEKFLLLGLLFGHWSEVLQVSYSEQSRLHNNIIF